MFKVVGVSILGFFMSIIMLKNAYDGCVEYTHDKERERKYKRFLKTYSSTRDQENEPSEDDGMWTPQRVRFDKNHIRYFDNAEAPDQVNKGRIEICPTWG